MAYQAVESEKKVGTGKTEKFLQEAMKRFDLAEEAERTIRKNALDDLRFRAGDQWPMNVRTSRDIEMRPCLTINRMPQFIRQVTNDARQNRPQLRIDAADDSTEESAEVLEGLVRHIQVSSNADIAYDTACDHQVTMGFGYFRVLTEYVDANSFDQEIKIKRVKNPFTIYFDPHTKEPDYSDAQWCFVIDEMRRADFETQYPDAEVLKAPFTSIGDKAAGWMSEETVRIAEYWCVHEKEKTIYLLSDGSKSEKEPLPDSGLTVIKERKSSDRTVKCYKITGSDILEETEWAGKYIPIIPVLGDDLDVDGKRDLVGLIRYAQDPQRMYNYWSTAQTEAIALAPKAPYLMAEGQDEGYERFWDNANTKTFSRLVYKPVTIAGQIAPPPQRNTAEPPIQAMTLALRQAADDMKSTTGIYDASLGARGNETSGTAIQTRQRESDVSNFHFIDNLSRAIRFLGVILLDLIPKIYDAPRVVRILHEDQTSKTVKINQTLEEKDENGINKIYDLTTGKYDVVVNVGPSYMTKRQEAAESMVQISQAYPPLMQIAGDIMVKNMDWPGAKDVAERLKKMLPPQLAEPEEGQPQQLPPQVQSQMQQMQQMIEELTKALNAAHDKSDAKQIELNSKEKIAAEKIRADMMKTVMTQQGSHNLEILKQELAHGRTAGNPLD